MESGREIHMREKNVLTFVITAVVMTVLGLLLGMAGAMIGAHSASPTGFEALGVAIIGMVTGYVLGAVMGLFLLKYTVHVYGSVLLGVFAAVAWTFVSIGVAELMNRFHDASSVIVVLMFLLIPTVSLSGFYLKRAAAS